MKTILPCLLFLILIGCNQSKEKVDNRIFIEKNIKSFLKANPNWKQNEIYTDSLNTIFVDSILAWSKTPQFLNGIPLVLDELKKIEGLMTAVGEVEYETYRPDTSFINHINLKILFILKPEMVSKIRSGSTYYVWGRVKKLLAVPEGLPRDYLSDFGLGIYTFEADSISDSVYK